MQHITSSKDLKKAILLLEEEQAIKKQLLKDKFITSYEKFKRYNVIRGLLKEITSSPSLINNILGMSTGLASGYITKKIVVGTSGNIFRKLVGSLLQFGVANTVAQHPNTIKNFGQFLFKYFFDKKENNFEKK